MTGREPSQEFGKRKPVAPSLARSPKRSGHVALLLMGTFAVGGTAYALMPVGCEPSSPVTAAPSAAQAGAGCASRGSSGGGSGGHGRSSRSSFFSGDASGGGSAAATSDAASGGVTRGGFGSFARAFGFSRGG